MVQMEQADELVQEPQMAQYLVQDAAQPVCALECMPGLLIAHTILKSRMNREVHVRFCEEQGVKFPLLTRLAALKTTIWDFFALKEIQSKNKQWDKLRNKEETLYRSRNLAKL